jgi:hypothetical protein
LKKRVAFHFKRKMNYAASLVNLPPKWTLRYLKMNLGLNDDVILKLEAQGVDGRFLKERYARGELRKTLASPPFSLPYGTAHRIDGWVQEVIRGAEEFEVLYSPPSSPSVEGQTAMNPFVASMSIQSQNKTMLASTLLSQRDDVMLKKYVARLMLVLGDNDAWLRFAKAKGATSGAEAEKRISEAQLTGEPETIVVPAIAQAPGYLALTFLSELKTMAGTTHVVDAVETIEQHLACMESAAQNKGNKVAEVNGSIRQWIIQFELCDITSQSEIQARVDALKSYEVTSLDDLKILDTEDFEKCGFRGVKAKKAVIAAKK